MILCDGTDDDRLIGRNICLCDTFMVIKEYCCADVLSFIYSRQTLAFLYDLYRKFMSRFHPPPILTINFPYKHDYIEVPYGGNAMVPTAEKC